MTSTPSGHTVADIVNWTKEHISAMELEYDFSKNLTKTTKQTLTQYLLKISEAQHELNAVISEKHNDITKLSASIQDWQNKHTTVSQLLTTQTDTIKGLNKQIKKQTGTVSKRIEELTAQKSKVTELEQNLDTMKKKNNKLSKNLQEKVSLLKKMSPKSMESVLTVLPDWVSSGTKWKDVVATLEKEKLKLAKQLDKLQKKITKSADKTALEISSPDTDKSELATEIQRLSDENEQLLVKATQNADKVGETIGDYEKRENYQVAKDYEEFCLYQGLDYLTEEIVAAGQKKGKTYNESKHQQQMLRMKLLLVNNLLVKPYDIQVRKLRTKKKLLDFPTFKKKHLKSFLKELAVTEKITDNFYTIAEKGFNLINELTSLKPPCQLLFPEQGSVYSETEHEVDKLYSKPQGTVKFTLVPGLYAAHEVLMKPIVVTEKTVSKK